MRLSEAIDTLKDMQEHFGDQDIEFRVVDPITLNVFKVSHFTVQDMDGEEPLDGGPVAVAVGGNVVPERLPRELASKRGAW